MTTENKIVEAEERISLIKTKMILDMPFFGIIISKLNTKPSKKEKSIGIDGQNLIYSPDFVLDKHTTEDLLLFIFIHETFHIILNHLDRQAHREEELWNISCDFVVNGHIMNLPNSQIFGEIIKNCYWNINFNDKIAEEVYELLSMQNSDETSDYNSSEADDSSSSETEEKGEGDESDDNEKNESTEEQDENIEENSENESTENDENSNEDKNKDEDEGVKNDLMSEESNPENKNNSAQNSNENTENLDNEDNKNVDPNKENSNKNSNNDSKNDSQSQQSPTETGNTDKMISSHSHWDKQEDNKDAREESLMSIRHAYDITKNHGSTPTFMAQIIEEFFQPKQDWRVLLANFIEPLYPDYTFNPPSYMYPTFEFIMPEERPCDDGVLDIFIYIDSSGSIPQEVLVEISSEIKNCYQQFGDKSVIYYGDWSTEASDPKILDDPKDIKFEMSGGTEPKCIFEKLKELDKLHEARGIIIITDGYFSILDTNVAEGIEVLWLITEKGTVSNLSNWDNVIQIK